MPFEEKYSTIYRTFNEIVIDQESQVVPIFIVLFDNLEMPPASHIRIPTKNLEEVEDAKLDVNIHKSPIQSNDEKSEIGHMARGYGDV